MTDTITAASPTKIRATGQWGARVDGAAHEGDTVRVTTRSGKQWDARVTRVWWTGADKWGDGTVSICSTEKRDRTPRRNISRSGGGQMDQLDCGHYPDNPQRGCFGCTSQIGL